MASGEYRLEALDSRARRNAAHRARRHFHDSRTTLARHVRLPPAPESATLDAPARPARARRYRSGRCVSPGVVRMARSEAPANPTRRVLSLRYAEPDCPTARPTHGA